jgi:hypothetical protein
VRLLAGLRHDSCIERRRIMETEPNNLLLSRRLAAEN